MINVFLFSRMKYTTTRAICVKKLLKKMVNSVQQALNIREILHTHHYSHPTPLHTHTHTYIHTYTYMKNSAHTWIKTVVLSVIKITTTPQDTRDYFRSKDHNDTQYTWGQVIAFHFCMPWLMAARSTRTPWDIYVYLLEMEAGNSVRYCHELWQPQHSWYHRLSSWMVALR